MENHSCKIVAPCNAVSTDKTYKVSKRQPQLINACGMPKNFYICERLAYHVNKKVVANSMEWECNTFTCVNVLIYIQLF